MLICSIGDIPVIYPQYGLPTQSLIVLFVKEVDKFPSHFPNRVKPKSGRDTGHC
jgi:hypothetical protein